MKQISTNSKNEINHLLNLNWSSSNLFLISLETSTLAGTNQTNTINKTDSLNINENKNASVDLVEKKFLKNITHDGSNIDKIRVNVLNDEQHRIREEKFTEVINFFT